MFLINQIWFGRANTYFISMMPDFNWNAEYIQMKRVELLAVCNMSDVGPINNGIYGKGKLGCGRKYKQTMLSLIDIAGSLQDDAMECGKEMLPTVATILALLAYDNNPADPVSYVLSNATSLSSTVGMKKMRFFSSGWWQWRTLADLSTGPLLVRPTRFLPDVPRPLNHRNVPLFCVHSETNSMQLGTARRLFAHISAQLIRPIAIGTHLYTSWTGASWRERTCPDLDRVTKGVSRLG